MVRSGSTASTLNLRVHSCLQHGLSFSARPIREESNTRCSFFVSPRSVGCFRFFLSYLRLRVCEWHFSWSTAAAAVAAVAAAVSSANANLASVSAVAASAPANDEIACQNIFNVTDYIVQIEARTMLESPTRVRLLRSSSCGLLNACARSPCPSVCSSASTHSRLCKQRSSMCVVARHRIKPALARHRRAFPLLSTMPHCVERRNETVNDTTQLKVHKTLPGDVGSLLLGPGVKFLKNSSVQTQDRHTEDQSSINNLPLIYKYDY